MPMCEWCGDVVSAAAARDFQNGAKPLRLCPACAQSEQARGLNAVPPVVLEFERHGDVWEEAAPAGTPRWILITAFLVLVAFVAPVILAVLGQ